MTEDIEMNDVSVESWITNAPPLPRRLIYKKETYKDKRKFAKEYQKYLNTLLFKEMTMNKPFVTACVDVWQRDQIMRFEMDKYPKDITE